ncbi:MAG TPA: histidine kinase, partial [Spongiibacteraceae bacterium]|nr:histidine kinase [Spongiibacteraceae bacterium]
MAVERRDYVALEWVAGEIAETLKQSVAELNAYLENRADTTRLRFCLTYIHQVYGTLKMVEFAGAALLTEEMEAVAQALVGGTVLEAQREDALLALKTALDSLPGYLQRLLVQRRDAPALLLPLINDLRAVRGEVLITESAVFSPDLTTRIDSDAQPLSISAGELGEIAKKLRQMYQMALLNYLRNNDPRQNLNYLAKVCARLSKLASARPAEALWKICIALCEGLLNRSIQPSAAVKLLLRQVDSQLKVLVEQGEAALQAVPPTGLIKNLLYYIAASGANSRYIAEIKQTYNLPNALPPETELVPSASDDDATVAVKAALAQQLANLAHDIPTIPVGKGLIAAIKRVQDTAALLGLARAQATLQELVQRVQSGKLDVETAVRNLHQLAESLELEQRPAAPRPLFNDSEEAQEQLDKAFDAVMRESRNSLEQAKEAIIEFVATQWRHQCLEEVPELIAGVRGSFAVAGLHRAAAVLAACENYVRKDLLEQRKIPAWQLLDTLADAIASVDYYVERLSEDAAAECESILDIA